MFGLLNPQTYFTDMAIRDNAGCHLFPAAEVYVGIFLCGLSIDMLTRAYSR